MNDASKAGFISLALIMPLVFPVRRGLAQRTQPSLGDALERLEANLRRYDNSLPSLFCNETVVSKVEPSFPRQAISAMSVFRLKRIANSDGTSSLVESRDAIGANGENPTDHASDLPTQLDGAFEGAFAVVSRSQANCFEYRMNAVDKRHPTAPYVIRFSSRLTSHDSSTCLLNEKSNGFVRIDPASFEIMHLEINTPHHIIPSGNEYVPPSAGRRAIVIDYSPVSLDHASYWLPSSIDLRVVQGSGTFKQTTWTFRGEYAGCHQLQVTSRILTEHEAAQH